MVMQKRAWMTSFLFKEFLTFFKKYVPNGVTLVSLDGHGSHVTLEAIKHA